MFQTNRGPSFPAHQFLFGGTSAPNAADEAVEIFAAENTAGASALAGCAAPPGTTVAVINPASGENSKIYPCFEHQTMPDLLPPFITWRYYAPSAGGPSSIAGRIDPMVVPLQRQAAYIVHLQWAAYPKMDSGTYDFYAEVEGTPPNDRNLDMPGENLLKCWVGIVKSNEITLTVP